MIGDGIMKSRLVGTGLLSAAIACQVSGLVTDQKTAAQEAAAQEATAQEATAQEATAQEATAQVELPPLDVLLVVDPSLQHRYSPQGLYAQRDKKQTEKMLALLRELPDQIAGSNYQIALIGDYCIQPVITKNSTPDPVTALEAAFEQTILERLLARDGKYHGPGRGVPGGYYQRPLNRITTALTDFHTSDLSLKATLPEPGTSNYTDQSGRDFSYVELADGAVRLDIDGKLFVQYRKMKNGLISTHSYDAASKVKCGQSWLREDAFLVVVVLASLPSTLCVVSHLCTMPDIEQILRDLGYLHGQRATLERRYRLYGLTSTDGDLFRYPYPDYVFRSERASATELKPLLIPADSTVGMYHERYAELREKTMKIRVDWSDFENYAIDGGGQRLVDYLGSIDDENDYRHIYRDIVQMLP